MPSGLCAIPSAGGMSAEISDRIGIEAFDDDRSVVMRQRGRRRAPRRSYRRRTGSSFPRRSAFARRSPPKKAAKLGIGQSPPAQLATSVNSRCAKSQTLAVPRGQALQRVVVENDKIAIGCKLHVAFDAKLAAIAARAARYRILNRRRSTHHAGRDGRSAARSAMKDRGLVTAKSRRSLRLPRRRRAAIAPRRRRSGHVCRFRRAL